MSRAAPAISRRRLLAGTGLLTVLGVAAACGSAPAPPPIDDLESQLRLARDDSELAVAAGANLPGGQPAATAAALAQIGTERAEHARALAREIARAAGTPEPAPTEPATTADHPVPAVQPPTVADVIDALRAAAASAGQLAAAQSGYRAGLLASIAAACTAGYTVALAAPL